MTHFFYAGGPFMWPILFCSVVGIFSAVIYARSSRSRHAVVAAGSIASALTLALLSVATGFQFAVDYVGGGEVGAGHAYLLGLSEALNGLDLALLAALGTIILVSVGAYRRYRQVEAREVS